MLHKYLNKLIPHLTAPVNKIMKFNQNFFQSVDSMIKNYELEALIFREDGEDEKVEVVISNHIQKMVITFPTLPKNTPKAPA